MSNLGEDTEAFFRKGDEGTYEGGPGSVIPLELCDDTAEDAPIGVTEGQLERRRRFKRVVGTIVGTLGSGLVLALLLGTSARATDDEGPSANPPPQPPSKMAAVAAASTAPAPSPRVATAAAIEEARVPPPSLPSASARPEATTVQNVALPRATPSLEGRLRVKPSALPNGRAAFARAATVLQKPSFRSPPTANFPD